GRGGGAKPPDGHGEEPRVGPRAGRRHPNRPQARLVRARWNGAGLPVKARTTQRRVEPRLVHVDLHDGIEAQARDVIPLDREANRELLRKGKLAHVVAEPPAKHESLLDPLRRKTRAWRARATLH